VSQDLLGVLKSFFYFVKDVFFGGLVDAFGLYDITTIPKKVEHYSHCCRATIMSLFSMSVKQPHHFNITVND